MKTTYRPHCKVKCLGKTLFEISLLGKVFVCAGLSTNHTHTNTHTHCGGILVYLCWPMKLILYWCDIVTALWKVYTSTFGEIMRLIFVLKPTLQPLPISAPLHMTFFGSFSAKITRGLAKHVKLFPTGVCISFSFFQRKTSTFCCFAPFSTDLIIHRNSICNARGAYLVFCL